MVTKLEQLKEWAKQHVTLIDLLPNNNNLQVTTRLIDVLEDEVDEKYYLSEEKTKKLTLDINLTFDEEPRISIVENTSRTNYYAANIYDSNGLSTTVAARDYMGPKQIIVREATKQGYAVAEQGDSVNVSYPTSKTRRGRVGKQVAQTLQAGEVNQGVVIGGDFDDKEIERDTFEILQTLQKEIGEKEIAEWRSRILDTFQQEEILRQDVYEKGLDIEQNKEKLERKEQSDECEIKNTTFDRQEKMRKVSFDKEFRCTPCGRKPVQQLTREFTSIMQKLSHETSQEKKLHRLRETTQGFGLLQQALYKIQEVWGSSLHKKQGVRIRKLTEKECWRLQSFTDEQFYKAKESGVSNSQLYKQAGNSVTVNVVDAIVKCL